MGVIKLGGAVDSLKGTEALQRDSDKLESWEIRYNMKLKKRKFWVLHLGRGKDEYTYIWGKERVESSPTEMDLGVLSS